jgi:hypothetical protein
MAGFDGLTRQHAVTLGGPAAPASGLVIVPEGQLKGWLPAWLVSVSLHVAGGGITAGCTQAHTIRTHVSTHNS